jgi:hypothetical protein
MEDDKKQAHVFNLKCFTVTVLNHTIGHCNIFHNKTPVQ